MSRFLLDTNICIYIIKQKPPSVREKFSQHNIGDIAISSITVAELVYGVEKSSNYQKNKDALEDFLLPLKLVDFDTQDARVYGRIRSSLERRGQPIGGMDLLIASQALAKGLTLVSNNLREFGRVDGLKCENWL